MTVVGPKCRSCEHIIRNLTEHMASSVYNRWQYPTWLFTQLTIIQTLIVTCHAAVWWVVTWCCLSSDLLGQSSKLLMAKLITCLSQRLQQRACRYTFEIQPWVFYKCLGH